MEVNYSISKKLVTHSYDLKKVGIKISCEDKMLLVIQSTVRWLPFNFQLNKKISFIYSFTGVFMSIKIYIYFLFGISCWKIQFIKISRIHLIFTLLSILYGVLRLKSFYEEGEKEMMTQQISDLQNKVPKLFSLTFEHCQIMLIRNLHVSVDQICSC